MFSVRKLYLTAIIISLSFLLILGCTKKDSNPSKAGKNKSTTQTYTDLKFDKSAVTSDPFNDPKGPYYHKVYKATSEDGLNFTRETEVMLDKASVPDIVKTKDGHLIIYAVDGSGRSFANLMLAISKDNGDSWKTGSLHIDTGDGQQIGAADPQAVLTDDGKIRLFYLVFPEKKPPLDENGQPKPTGEKTKIKSAISNDGINFKEEKGARYESTDFITDPDVVKIGNKWFMYVSKERELLAASSDDGDTFDYEKSIRTIGSVSKTVSIGGGKYRQFYCGDGGIDSTVTSDGLNWTDEEGSRLKAEQEEIICDPTPVKVGNKWLMFFKSAPMPQRSVNDTPPPPK